MKQRHLNFILVSTLVLLKASMDSKICEYYSLLEFVDMHLYNIVVLQCIVSCCTEYV